MDVVKHFRLSHDPFRAERDAVGAPMLTHEEARRFIAARIGAAGHADLFSSAALDMLATASRGRPAALRLLASNAMFHAAFDGARRVEETHARQAAATQDIWRDVPVSAEASAGSAVAGAPVVAAAPVVAPAAEARPSPAPIVIPAAAVAAAAAIDDAEPVGPRHRSWWRSAPPLARLAIVVGLVLLSLPVIGYFVGMVKDDRPATESSYLPDEGEVADAEAPIDAAPELPPPVAPAPVEVATARPPVDLTAQTTIAEEPPPAPAAEEPSVVETPAVVGAGTVETAPAAADPAPAVEEPAPEATAEPVAAAPRVFVHYSTSQPGGAEAAADVARRLREQGFDVVDIRAVPMSIETASVRYFFPADRARAEALHDALGVVLRPRGYSAGDLKSMTDYDPAPRRGTLEVWVPAG